MYCLTFSLAVLPLLHLARTSEPKEQREDKCDWSQRENFAFAERYRKQSCYFQPWGTLMKVHVYVDQFEGYLLDVELLRRICQYFNASLPAIENEDEERFLANLEHGYGKTVLGLKKTGSKYIWEDGTPFTYSNKDWRRKDHGQCQYTLLVPEREAIHWEDVPCNATHYDGLAVLCKEQYHKRRNQSGPSKPPWNEEDECELMNEHKFSKVKKFKNESCYFEIKDGNEMVNKFAYKDKGLSYFTFDVELARNICMAYNATLPILRSKKEEQELIDFSRQTSNFVALGLRASKNGYMWDDGTQLTYENPRWRKQEKPGTYYTLLVFISGEGNEPFWMEVPMNETVLNGAPMLCDEQYADGGSTAAPTSKTTTATTTTTAATTPAITTTSGCNGKIPSVGMIIALFYSFCANYNG